MKITKKQFRRLEQRIDDLTAGYHDVYHVTSRALEGISIIVRGMAEGGDVRMTLTGNPDDMPSDLTVKVRGDKDAVTAVIVSTGGVDTHFVPAAESVQNPEPTDPESLVPCPVCHQMVKPVGDDENPVIAAHNAGTVTRESGIVWPKQCSGSYFPVSNITVTEDHLS